MNFTYQYFFLNIDGTTQDGATITLSGTVVAGDKTANKGHYIAALIDASTIQAGAQIIGVFKRVAGTYGSDVALCEFGIHAPVCRTGIAIP